jgi:hypothetical protein
MVDHVCKTCPFSALCIGAGGLEELISRMITEHLDEFIKSGPDAETTYEQDAVRAVGTKQAVDRTTALLETKLPTKCPLLRRHDANSEGTSVDWQDSHEVPDE